jgi:hypothetical protein
MYNLFKTTKRGDILSINGKDRIVIFQLEVENSIVIVLDHEEYFVVKEEDKLTTEILYKNESILLPKLKRLVLTAQQT